MNNLAIITARGGSKRIPRKNIKDFLGKPIIAYSIDAALSSGLFSEVMVSTDDDEIAEVAIKYGAKVPFIRSAKNSDDFATTNDVIWEVIHSYKALNINFEYACCLYPTAPLITKKLLEDCYEKIALNIYDLVLPIVAYSFPVLRSFVRDENGNLQYAFPENINKRSQDLQKHYHDAGQLFFIKIDDYLKRGAIVGNKIFGVELSELEVQDIDNEEDWKLAELKYKLLNKL